MDVLIPLEVAAARRVRVRKFVDERELRLPRQESIDIHLPQPDSPVFNLPKPRLGRPEATDEEVIAAVRALDCLDVIGELPNGLATVVGERGAGISAGQRQVVCFARAMLADPRILILDEATSAIDTLTEARLQLALERLLRGRTSFVVAHRLSTIRNAGQILVLAQGRIVERGRHDDLVARDGVYAALHRQFVAGG